MIGERVNEKKRLAFLLPDLRGGGAQRVVLNLVKGISEQGYAVDLVLARAEGALLPQVVPPVRIVDLGAKRSLASLPALVRYLRRIQPAVLLSAVQHVNVIALLARRLSRARTRLIVSEHSVPSDLMQYAPSYRGRLVPYLGHLYCWADGIVAVSHAVADDLARVSHMPRSRIQVIYNPVITPALRTQAKMSVSHPWFGPAQPPVVLGVGRLSASKSFASLIRAFACVRAKRPARLMILGEGEERPALEALIRELNLTEDVSLPGFVETPAAYMQQASLFVLSSTSEALPTVLIEAMYCGLPLIATACPGGAREILDDGRYGRLVPVGDIAALVQAMVQTLDEAHLPPEPKAWHASDAWRTFELNTVVEQYLDVLLERKRCEPLPTGCHSY